jgi:hypothetical protein
LRVLPVAGTDVAGETVSTTLNTQAKTILAGFTFGSSDYAGALKAGDITWNTTTGAVTGGSGVVVHKGGILGAAAGVATFTLNATTGAATFAGDVNTSGYLRATGGTTGLSGVATVVAQPAASGVHALTAWALGTGQGLIAVATGSGYAANIQNTLGSAEAALIMGNESNPAVRIIAGVTQNAITTLYPISVGTLTATQANFSSNVNLTSATSRIFGGTTSGYLLIGNSDGSSYFQIFGPTHANAGKFTFVGTEITLSGPTRCDNILTGNAQPAFLAYNSATDSNQTGNGAVVTVDFDTEVFDQSSNFAADTFTAPVDGRYRLSAAVSLATTTSASISVVTLITTNRSYLLERKAGLAGYNILGGSVIADMDASDTAYITLQVSGEAGDTVAVGGNASTLITYFSGELVC